MAITGGAVAGGRVLGGRLVLPLLAGALLLGAAAAGGGVLPGDVAATRAVQDVTVPGAGAVAGAANWAGGGAHLTLLAALVGVGLGGARRFGDAAFVAAALAVRALNPALKAVTESPRPSPDLVRVSEEAAGWGFPSGHAMGVVLIYGGIGYLVYGRASRRWVRALVVGLAVAAIAATGFGRVYAGAHWPSDVLGGLLWGTGLLLALVRARQAIRGVAVPRRSVGRSLVESGHD